LAASCDLVDRVAATLDACGLFRDARCVLVGVSGGADSVALLAVLRELAERAGAMWRLAAAHLNHGIRAAAAADARFVQALCASWQVECIVGAADVPAESRRTGESIEAAARRARYAFLADAAERADAQAVAVAHHADDNAETVLHRVLRGTGLAGLAGIPVERPLGAVRLVRPMLHCRRADIEQFLAARGLSWREDESNRDLDHRRNFLRHDLLPHIREHVNPRAEDALLRLAEQAQAATAFLRTEAEKVLQAAVEAVQRDAGASRGEGVSPSCPAGILPASGVEGDWTSSSGQSHGTHNAGETPASHCGPPAFSAAVLAAAYPAVRSEAIRLAFEQAGLPARDLSAAVVARVCDLLYDPAVKSVNLPRDWRLTRRRDVVRLLPPVSRDTKNRRHGEKT